MVNVIAQELTSTHTLYNGDSCDVLPSLPDECAGIQVYSPPFRDLLRYSSSDRDLGNCRTPEEFLDHFRFIVNESFRIAQRGRMSCVHCMDLGGAGKKPISDFPAEIRELHEEAGFDYWDRKTIFKEPWRVARRTRALSLKHGQVVTDASWCRSALPDYLLVFRKPGEPETPIVHPRGFTDYPGEFPIFPPEAGWEDQWRHLKQHYKDWEGDQRENKLSHAIWRRLASPIWDDVRIDRVLPFESTKDDESEKHVCPLQLDVIERCLMLWSIKGDTLVTPFLGVGSEAFSAVSMGRLAIGCELKPIYYRQAVDNVKAGAKGWRVGADQQSLDLKVA